jgi:Rad52/22 family double-strand break repair protein
VAALLFHQEKSMADDAKMKKLLEALSAPFPEEAIERTDGRTTGRGYSTTGIKVQYVIMRLNACAGLGGWRLHRELTVREMTTANGRKCFETVADVILELGEWREGKFIAYAEAVADGGHVSTSISDSRKGATSNGLKKAAAIFGCGWQAFAGVIDDDNVPSASNVDVPTQHQQSSSPPGFGTAPDVSIRRQPAATPAVPASAPAEATRNRVSSKQLGAVWAIGRKAGLEQSSLRAQVKAQYGVQLEFLSRQQASDLIDALSRKLAANGHADGGAEAMNGA